MPSIAAAMPARPHIRQVAVLGAGVMGAQIAAHCANAGVPVLLFDLGARDAGDTRATARAAIARLGKLKPAPLGAPASATLIQPASYDDDLHRLSECDLIIEAIAEKLDWKRELYARIAPALAPHAWLASNTSGLSIETLSAVLPADLHERFCGVHFFNPPRYMPLVELIPTASTSPHLIDALETFLVSGLGKSVVRARDTPNFIGNRIGVFGILATMSEADRFGLDYALVDELTGKRLGRAKSGTFRTADVVGLDTLAHVIGTLQSGLPDDPFASCYATPQSLASLVAQGHLGQKTGSGFYKKTGSSIEQWNVTANDYVPMTDAIDPGVAAMLAERDVGARLRTLRESAHPQAQFVWAILRDTFHYSAVHLADIADTVRDVDQAMRWGFGQRQGPFELWQAAGWTQVTQWIEDDIKAGRTLSAAPLPDWVHADAVIKAGGVYAQGGAFSPATGDFRPGSSLPIYDRHIVSATTGRRLVVRDTPDLSTWTLAGSPFEDVLIVSFNTKMNTIGQGVIDGLMAAVDQAEKSHSALVIYNGSGPFSAGADLQGMLPTFMTGGPAALEPMERALQGAALRLRYASVPTVAALGGLVLGGGCELAVHASSRVALFESYIGLVEVGVGLVPGAGGLAFCARRAYEQQQLLAPHLPLLGFLRKYAEAIAGAKVSASALEARSMGYLQESDAIVMHQDELLHAALARANGLAQTGYRAPAPTRFAVAGRVGAATLTTQLVNLRDGGFISAYDFKLGRTVASVLCGGDVDAGTEVDEHWLMAREREAFLHLLAQPNTQARIMGMLKTGKPVRN